MVKKEIISTTPHKHKKHTREVMAKIAIAALALAGTGAAGTKILKDINDHGLNPPPIIQGVTESLEQFERKIVNNNMETGMYEMSPVPGREAESLTDIPTLTTIADIPHIPEVETLITPNITLGATFIDAHEVFRNSELRKAPPTVIFAGYLAAIERSERDGSVMFAIELPRLSSPKDLLKGDVQKSTGEIKEPTFKFSPAENTIIGGRIVWIRLFEGQTPAHYPFATNIVWGPRELQSLGTASDRKAGTGDKPLIEYARPGDLIRVKVDLDSYETPETQEGLESFIRLSNNGETVQEAKERFKRIIASNAQNAQNLVADIGKPIAIADQIRDKSYVFTPGRVALLPK